MCAETNSESEVIDSKKDTIDWIMTPIYKLAEYLISKPSDKPLNEEENITIVDYSIMTPVCKIADVLVSSSHDQDSTFSSDADSSLDRETQSFIENFFKIDYSSCTSQNHRILKQIAFVTDNIPKKFFATTQEELSNDKSPSNIFLSDLVKLMNPTTERELITMCHLQTSITVANVTHLFDAYNRPDVICKMYNETFNKIISYYQH